MTSGLRSVRDKVVVRLDDRLAAASPHRRLHEVVTAFGDELKAVRAGGRPLARGERPPIQPSRHHRRPARRRRGTCTVHGLPRRQLGDGYRGLTVVPHRARPAYGKPILDRLLHAGDDRCRASGRAGVPGIRRDTCQRCRRRLPDGRRRACVTVCCERTASIADDLADAAHSWRVQLRVALGRADDGLGGPAARRRGPRRLTIRLIPGAAGARRPGCERRRVAPFVAAPCAW